MVSEKEIAGACNSAGWGTKTLGESDVVCSKSGKEIYFDVGNIKSIKSKGKSLIVEHSKPIFTQFQDMVGGKARLIL